VFIISDKDKHKLRDTYLVVKDEETTVDVVKGNTVKQQEKDTQ